MSIHFLFLYNETINSQNLVPNSSFENYIDCPLCHAFLGAIESAYPWQSTFPLGGSTDYYNTCTFDDCETTIAVGLLFPNYMRQIPRTGNGMAGFITFDPSDTSGVCDYKEYLQIELLTNLKTNTKYCFPVGCHFIITVYMLSTKFKLIFLIL